MSPTSRRRHIVRWIQASVLFLALSNQSPLQAQASYPAETVIKQDTQSLSLNTNIDYIEDPSARLTIHDIIQKRYETGWQRNLDKELNLGLSSSAFWLRLIITSELRDNDFYLEICEPTLNSVQLYKADGTGFLVMKSGLDHISSEQQIKHRCPIFSLSIEPFQTQTLYLRIFSKNFLNLPLRLMTHDYHYEKTKVENFAFGAYYGGVLVVMVVNLCQWLLVRDKVYLYYSMYALFVILANTCAEGYFLYYVLNHPSWLRSHAQDIFGAACIASLAQFVRAYLQTRLNLSRLDKTLSAICFLTPLIALWNIFFGSWITMTSIIILINLNLVVAFIAGLYSLPYLRQAKYFVTGFFFYFLFMVIFFLVKIGVITDIPILQYSIQIGTTIEYLLLSLGLADRVSFLNQTLVQQHTELNATQAVLKQQMEARAKEQKDLEYHRAIALHSAKLASLGEMAAGIIHEITNPLAIIAGKAHSLKILMTRNLQGIPEASQYLDLAEAIQKNVNRIEAIIKSLRTFARDGKQDRPRPVPASEIMRDSLDLCVSRLRDQMIDLEVEFPTDTLTVSCRPIEIAQVLLNMLTNAFDAVESVHKKWVRFACFEEGEFIKFIVEDSGPGVAPEFRLRLMEPFFTTKPLGKGMGLGLAISRRIAESVSGLFYFDANAPVTRFVLKLPKGM